MLHGNRSRYILRLGYFERLSIHSIQRTTQTTSTNRLLGRPRLVGKGLSFTHELSFFFFFFINPPCSEAAQLMGHQMYFGGGVKKCEIWRRLKHHSNLSRPRLKIQQDIRNLKQKCNAAMIALCPRQVWWSWGPRTSEKALSLLPHPLKLHAKTC